MRRWILPALSATVCALSVAALVPPALAATADGGASPSTARPSVRLDGALATDGLPSAAALSALTVVNDGAVPVRWTVHGTLAGAAAAAAQIDVLAPVDGGCSSTGAPMHGWSPTALAPGATAVVCVRISTPVAAPGSAVPTVTVDAQAA